MRFTKTNIVPSEFRYLVSYDLGGFEPGDIPFGLKEAGEAIDVKPVENFEDLDKCCVCGTRYRYGDVWVHEPTNTRICLGWRCAEKYGLMASRGEFEGQRASAIRKAQAEAKRKENAAKMIEFLTEHPKVRVWLSAEHHITQDIKNKLHEWGSISDKQMDLLERLYRQEQERKAIEATAGPQIPVPITDERIEIVATLLGTKYVEGWGYNTEVLKMIVRVETDEGQYKLYGTMPDCLSLIDIKDNDGNWINQIALPKGSKVRFFAKVERSKDDPNFGFFKRPTKAEVIELNYEQEVTA